MLALALFSAFALTTQAWPGQDSTENSDSGVARSLFTTRRRRSTTTEPQTGRRRRSTTTEAVTVPPKQSHQIPGILIGTGVGIAGAVAAGTGIALAMAHDHDTFTGSTTTALPTLSQSFPPTAPPTTFSPTFPPTTFSQTFPPATLSQTFPPVTTSFFPSGTSRNREEEGSSSFAAALAIAALLCLCCLGLLGFLAFAHGKKKTKPARPMVRPEAAAPRSEPVQEPLMAQGHWEQPMGHWEQEKQIVKVTTPSHVPEIVSWAPAATTMAPSYTPAATSLYTPANYAPLATTQNYMALPTTQNYAPGVFAAPTMIS